MLGWVVSRWYNLCLTYIELTYRRLDLHLGTALKFNAPRRASRRPVVLRRNSRGNLKIYQVGSQ